MLEVRSVRKRFGSVTAVDGVSFAAPDGQITGLLGENGAGKTTTLALIGGVLTPDEGSIEIDGADAASEHPPWPGRTGSSLAISVLVDAELPYPELQRGRREPKLARGSARP